MYNLVHVFFFSGMPLMECFDVDDTSPEHTIVGFTPGWVDTDVSWLYIGIIPPQPGGMWASLSFFSSLLVVLATHC